MASNMIWAHEITHYFYMGHFNKTIFIFGICLSLFITFILVRNKLFIDDKQWLRRMINHHSTAQQLHIKFQIEQIIKILKN